MSTEKTDLPNPLAPKMKDTLILIGWISGIIIIAGLCWFLTQPLRESYLVKSINKVLEQSHDLRRVGEALPALSPGMGSWFAMTNAAGKRRDNAREALSEGTRACVFVFIAEGSFFPCIAVVSPGGAVEEFIPLNSHGKRILKQVSPGILKIYAARIEGAQS